MNLLLFGLLLLPLSFHFRPFQLLCFFGQLFVGHQDVVKEWLELKMEELFVTKLSLPPL